MEFSPDNPIVKLCLRAMHAEENANTEEAERLFLQAWKDATNDFEKFLAAFYLARQQATVDNKLQWTQTALKYAHKLNDAAVKAAFPGLYTELAKCYEASGDQKEAEKNYDLAASLSEQPSDAGPFYHGTKADLMTGDLLTPGNMSNYQSQLVMNHIYFTALVNGAGLAAALAKGEGHERVYIVEPTGEFENDPNVTNKKFPGNPTRSYRTMSPLKIVGEMSGWQRVTAEQLKQWREKLDNNKGEIIN